MKSALFCCANHPRTDYQNQLSQGPYPIMAAFTPRPIGDVVVQGINMPSIVAKTAVFASKATIGSAGNYGRVATAEDNGEPGTNQDQFDLKISSNPDGSTYFSFPPATITHGNIQMPL